MLRRDADSCVEFVRTRAQAPDHRAELDRFGPCAEHEQNLDHFSSVYLSVGKIGTANSPDNDSKKIPPLDARLGESSGIPRHKPRCAAVRMGTRLDTRLAHGRAPAADRPCPARISSRPQPGDIGLER